MNMTESRFGCFHQTSSFRTVHRALIGLGLAYDVSKLIKVQPRKVGWACSRHYVVVKQLRVHPADCQWRKFIRVGR